MRYSDEWIKKQDYSEIKAIPSSSDINLKHLIGFSENRQTKENYYWVIKKPFTRKNIIPIACFSNYKKANDYLKDLSIDV